MIEQENIFRRYKPDKSVCRFNESDSNNCYPVIFLTSSVVYATGIDISCADEGREVFHT